MSGLTLSQECLSSRGEGPSLPGAALRGGCRGSEREAEVGLQKVRPHLPCGARPEPPFLSPHKRMPGCGEHLLLDVGTGYTMAFSSRKSIKLCSCDLYTVCRSCFSKEFNPSPKARPSALKAEPGPGPLLSGWLGSLVLLWGSLVHRSQHPCGHASRRWSHPWVQPCSGLAVGRCQESRPVDCGSGSPSARAGRAPECTRCHPKSLACGCGVHQPLLVSKNKT